MRKAHDGRGVLGVTQTDRSHSLEALEGLWNNGDQEVVSRFLRRGRAIIVALAIRRSTSSPALPEILPVALSVLLFLTLWWTLSSCKSSAATSKCSIRSQTKFSAKSSSILNALSSCLCPGLQPYHWGLRPHTLLPRLCSTSRPLPSHLGHALRPA